ncbi:MAG: ABC transporter permease [Lachnospiraceae bacterium]|nr:ABC transporter permease [Lachnospiraceae bacterium]
MNDYRKLAVRYLKLNKKRSIVTVIGVMVAVTVLYTLLNLGWSALLGMRENLRNSQDYEIVFLTENQSQIEQIMADDKVKSGSVGQYYHYDYYEPKMYDNALYINTSNPYRMDAALERISSKYGVEGEINYPLAATYLQGGEGNTTVIVILLVLLISFIFAIFGVGIVRNSIQLSILEQIKDYGNLRCIGASKGELKAVVYIEGAIIELAGIIFGVAVGTIASLLVGHFMNPGSLFVSFSPSDIEGNAFHAGFHWVPILPIIVAFLGDLFFAMEENCKVITNMTPVSAIRGEYRIRKEKIKVRKESIFGKLLGIEGDYAYKSIMRNPGRFYKTVWAMGIGIAAFIAIAGIGSSLNKIIRDEQEHYKYYHTFFENILDPEDTIDEVQSSLPSSDVLGELSNLAEVTDAKRMYSARLVLADMETYYKHYTDEYLTDSIAGKLYKILYEHYIQEGLEGGLMFGSKDLFDIACYGYDQEDYERYQSVLVDGTLDVSENGIVLVNHGRVEKSEEETESLSIEYIDVDYTDYKVGDTINLLDMQKLRTDISKELKDLTAEYEAEKEKLLGLSENDEENAAIMKEQADLEDEYDEKKAKIIWECKERLINEKSYKTYTIEGIVKEDVNHYNTGAVLILPLERYFALTGTDESMVTGMQYHFEIFPVNKYNRIIYGESGNYEEMLGNEMEGSAYPFIMETLRSAKHYLMGFLIFVVFVVMMTTFNIINTTAGNLHLRRKEFAQLRVIGVSKNRLMKMVLLEGVITTITANIVGIIIGYILSFGLFRLVITTLYSYQYHFPVAAALAGVLVSTPILCGSIYMPLKELKMDMAGDLSTGGD